jgi:hypothetical protein
MSTYSADQWDDRGSYGSLGVSTAANKAEALQEAKDWAKELLGSAPEDAWLRVNVDGVMSSFRLREL